jgi:adenylate cyclase
MSRSYYRQLALAPLGAASTRQLLADLLGTDPSLDVLAELVAGRTQGNPFFTEELVQTLVEGGSLVGERGAYMLAAPVAEAAVPASVQAALAARIDRLGTREKSVLQAAAVIGKEFPASVLERVLELEPGGLEEPLGKLVAGEFLYEQELYPEALYAFKHPLTQEVAYGSQLGERRAPAHAAVARAIAELYPERLDERAALVAQHWEAAGERLEAARWHARAGAWSGTGHPAQALQHWGKVRDLADGLPESAETAALGLTARIFALQFGWRLGISQEEADALFVEAERLALSAGDDRARALLIGTYGAVRGVGGGDVRGMATLTRQAIAIAEEVGDPALYMAISGGAYALFCIGEYREAVAICDRAIELADGDRTVGGGVNYMCPYAWCHGFKGMVMVILGEFDEARHLIEEGMRIAHEEGDVEVVGSSHLNATYLEFFAGNADAALGHARQALEISERIGNSFFRAYAWACLGLAEQMRGEWRAALDALERSAAIAREGRTAVEADLGLALIGQSYLGLGDPDRARALAEEALAAARAGGNVGSEMLAALALARALLGSPGTPPREEVEATLARVLELARHSGARAPEPVVHVELAELARQCGDREGRERELREAHRLFLEIGAAGQAEQLELELPTVG